LMLIGFSHFGLQQLRTLGKVSRGGSIAISFSPNRICSWPNAYAPWGWAGSQ
jgi:hypothetical protein